MNIKDKVVNEIGCFVAKWILHNCKDGLVIDRKGGAKQVIKVFAEPAYRNIIRPAIHKATEVMKAGDVVTDEGYHGEVVITSINGTGENAFFCGYYLSDQCHLVKPVSTGFTAVLNFRNRYTYVTQNLKNVTFPIISDS